VRFVVVGAGGFAVNVLVFAGLFGLGAWYLAASISANLVSNVAM
jgi:putative flippase GtrA